jgi:hypothetical protein
VCLVASFAAHLMACLRDENLLALARPPERALAANASSGIASCTDPISMLAVMAAANIAWPEWTECSCSCCLARTTRRGDRQRLDGRELGLNCVECFIDNAILITIVLVHGSKYFLRLLCWSVATSVADSVESAVETNLSSRMCALSGYILPSHAEMATH